LIDTSSGAWLQLERDDDTVSNLLDLYIFKSVSPEVRLPRSKLGQGNPYIESITSPEGFVIIQG
jgi:hypothetical protein